MVEWLDQQFSDTNKSGPTPDEKLRIQRQLAIEEARDHAVKQAWKRVFIGIFAVGLLAIVGKMAWRYWKNANDIPFGPPPVIESAKPPPPEPQWIVEPQDDPGPVERPIEPTSNRDELLRRKRQLQDTIASKERGMRIISGELAEKEGVLANLEGRKARDFNELNQWKTNLADSAHVSRAEYEARSGVSQSAARLRSVNANLKHNYDVVESLERRYLKAINDRANAMDELKKVEKRLSE
jgi:hypothetical protein